MLCVVYNFLIYEMCRLISYSANATRDYISTRVPASWYWWLSLR